MYKHHAGRPNPLHQGCNRLLGRGARAAEILIHIAQAVGMISRWLPHSVVVAKRFRSQWPKRVLTRKTKQRRAATHRKDEGRSGYRGGTTDSPPGRGSFLESLTSSATRVQETAHPKSYEHSLDAAKMMGQYTA